MQRIAPIAFSILLASCAVTPPVQEMSDARQAINAAKEANASELAPTSLRKAEESLDAAARGLEKKRFLDAREAAKEARLHAIRARDEALAAPTSSE